jgi:hypothetical protein
VIYPNLFTERLYIQDVTEKALLTIYSADGRIVWAATLENENTEIETSQLAAGMYIVNIRNEKVSRNFRVLKQ